MKSFKMLGLFIFILSTLTYQNSHAQFSDEEEEMLQLVNDIRAQYGREPVRLNPYLNQAAYDHSKDMGENNYFSHVGLNGSSFSQRAKDAGYEGSPTGENIAAGNSTAQSTFQQWVNSSGHLNNILNSGSNEMGIGHAQVNGSNYTHYWTQVFGKGDGTLSINEIIDPEIALIYPNPVKTTLHLDLQKGIQEKNDLKLISINGQTVYHKKNSSKQNINIPVSHLPRGIYFLKINEQTQSHKIVKE